MIAYIHLVIFDILQYRYILYFINHFSNDGTLVIFFQSFSFSCLLLTNNEIINFCLDSLFIVSMTMLVPKKYA